MKKNIIVWVHIAFWVLSKIADELQFFTINDSSWTVKLMMNDFKLTFYCVIIFYINYFWVARYLSARKNLKFISFLILSLLFFTTLASLIDPYFFKLIFHTRYTYGFWETFTSLIPFLISYALWGVFFRFTIDWFRIQYKQKDLERHQIASELALLRSQVNPHFLFNTLNNLHSFVHREPEKTQKGLEKLAEIMNYMLKDNESDWVPLENEINYIKNYIDLQKIRIKDKNFVTFDVSGDLTGKYIAPMLLVPFIENAFKHGKKVNASPGIIIFLQVNGNNLFFEITNSVIDQPEKADQKSGGLGLVNIRRRLELIYQGNYRLHILHNKEVFKASLFLQLTRPETIKS